MGGGGKVQICARIDDDLINWIDTQVDRKRFRTRSHALEFCVYALKEAESMKTQKVIV
jgi:Arc/MetJ-type ribon-helix-helix transcriptional regulator